MRLNENGENRLQDQVQMYSHVLEDREKLLLNMTEEYRESIMRQREFSEKMLSVPILEMKIKKMADKYFVEFTKILDHYSKDIKIIDSMLGKWRQCFTLLLETSDRTQMSSAIYEISRIYSTLTQLVVRFEPFIKKVEIQAIDEIIQNYHVKKEKKDKEIAQTRFVFGELEKMKKEMETDKDLSAKVLERTAALERLVGRREWVISKLGDIKKIMGRSSISQEKESKSKAKNPLSLSSASSFIRHPGYRSQKSVLGPSINPFLSTDSRTRRSFTLKPNPSAKNQVFSSNPHPKAF